MGLGGLFQSTKDRRRAKESVAVQRESLEFAKEQFALFQPLFQQFSNFFTDVSVEDIASGDVISPEAIAQISDINRQTQSQLSSLEENLASREIADTSAGEIIRQNLLTQSGRAKTNVRASSRDQALKNRLAFLNFGVDSLNKRNNASRGLSSALQFLSSLERDKDRDRSEAVGELVERGISAAVSLFGGGATGAAGAGNVGSALSAFNFGGGTQ